MLRHWSIGYKGQALLVTLDIETNRIIIGNKNTGEFIELAADSFDTFVKELQTVNRDINKTSNSKSSFAKARAKWPKAFTKWTDEDEKLLLETYKVEKDISKISDVMKRSEGGIISRLSQLNLISQEEDMTLRLKHNVPAKNRIEEKKNG